ncbi:hypothetical protein PsorP6_016900 [Peronosclerospora sorghi]|uniref:Uncharacterized protein n=1 Tax=Peronosclerospora sorghi TaxID=230839 RepID=A0ACC0WD81_9STRA|nr:hypothetical protein PsorP6_016900 [Peronosclerospora sorghi]
MAPSNCQSVVRSRGTSRNKKEHVTPSVAVGARCYIPDEDHAWLPVYVEEVNEQKGTVTVRIQRRRNDAHGQESVDHDDADRSGETRIVAINGGFPLQNAQLSRSEEGLENMIDLNHLHEAAILRNLKKRFRARQPYTYTGDICLAVNPYQWLEEQYTPGLHQKYLDARKRHDLPPHVYAVSVAAFRHMCERGMNQSILVSGESGAGKTETTKILMDNLATIAPVRSTKEDQDESITTRIIQVNPLLESFGNAKTTRNDNSSRFGKFTQLQFDKAHALCGAQCETYLLEKTRVISHDIRERNYHIFYQLLHGTTPAERDALGLGDACPTFAYLQAKDPQQLSRSGRKASGTTSSSSQRCASTEAETLKDQALFAKTRQALGLLGLSTEQQHDLFQVLSGILHLGEAQFLAKPDNDEACDLAPESVEYSSLLLGLNPDTMAKALTHRTMKAAGEVYLVPLTVEQAQSGRDALAKAIYASVFDWLVAGINASLGAAARVTATTIGVLDIFGFESFEHNSFEQLCINYANEKLQHKFTQDVFKAVQEEYEREKITWAHISYADNSETLALIEGRMGVLALLNEEIVRPRGNEEGFVSKLASAYQKQKNLIEFPRISKTQFAIHHYAGTVHYEATGFLEKHKDALLSDLSNLMCGSHERFPQMLFKVKADMEAASAALALKRSTSSSRKGAAGADKTVGMQFKLSLSSLMSNINETNVNYIRCIKPNSIKSSTLVEDKMVANQLRCAGVIEAICIARAGYPNRLLHAEFAHQFDLFLSANEQAQLQNEGETHGAPLCHVLVKRFHLETPEEYQMGVTKIYLQKGVLEKLEHAKAQKLFAYVALIQAQWRGMRTRCAYVALRLALRTIQRRVKVFVARCWFLRALGAIGIIQRVYRGYCGRCTYHRVLCQHKALEIQRVWRGHQGRILYLSILHELRATQIQRMWRGHRGRQIYVAVLCQTRALRLQCFVRQYLARQEVAQRRAAYIAKLEKEEQERVARELERVRQRKLEAERDKQRQLQEELARLEHERQVEEERKRQQMRDARAILIQKHVRGYFARCVFADLVQQAELEAQRRREAEEARKREAAEQEAQEKKRAAEERKRKALAMRQRREHAVQQLQRIVRGYLARVKVARLKQARQARQLKEERRRKEQEETAATRLQSIQRGRLARQQFATFKIETLEREEQVLRLQREQEQELIRVREETEQELAHVREETEQELAHVREETEQELARVREETERQLARVRDETAQEVARVRNEQKDEIDHVRAENLRLRHQLRELQRTNQELETLVAETQCNRDVTRASNTLKQVELKQQMKLRCEDLQTTRTEYLNLCDSVNKLNSSRRSTEPEELNSSDSGTSGDEANVRQKGKRRGLNSTAASYFDDDRPSTDIAKLLGSSSSRTARLASAMQQRRQQASQAVLQRKQLASSAVQLRREGAAQRKAEMAQTARSSTAASAPKPKRWGVALPLRKKKPEPTTPVDLID